MDAISLPILLAQVANFLILYLLFKKFVADKLLSTLNERAIFHEKLKHAEKERDQILEEARGERLQILADAKKEAKEYLKNSHDMAAQRVKEAVNRANKDVQMILAGGERRLQKERNVMLADLRDYIVEMTIKLNKKLFTDSKISKEFLENELDKLS